ncbi:MAG: hypothetical protein U5K27_20935 [Desulfotignum sp.]|nr:hypothetical protein [Desulfotignum sp.]
MILFENIFDLSACKNLTGHHWVLIDYHSIAHSNWSVFQQYFSFSKDGGKDKQLNWLKELNQIRNITHHAEKWPANKEQVAKVEIHKKVMENFPSQY